MLSTSVKFGISKLLELSIVISLVGASLPAKSVHAETGLVITPAVQEVSVGPKDDSASIVFSIANETPVEKAVSLSLADFSTSSDSTSFLLHPYTDIRTGQHTLASWIHIEKSLLTLAPGTSEQVRLTVETDESLAPGGHYGALVATADAAGSLGKDENGVQLGQALTGLILLKKTGGETRVLSLTDAEIPGFSATVPDSIRLRLLNAGNVHVVPRGTVTVTDWIGREVGRGVINEDSLYILPEASRTLRMPLHSVKFAWLPGRYAVRVEYRPDGNAETVVHSYTIWLFPWQGMLAIISGLIIVMLAAWWFSRRSARRRDRAKKTDSAGTPKKRRVIRL